MATTYTISGTVLYEDGIPALGSTVLVTDADGGIDDPVGASPVRLDGSFAFSASGDTLGEPAEGEPELHLSVFRDGDVVYTEILTAEPEMTVAITVQRETMPSVEDMMDVMEGMHHGMTEQRGLGNVPSDPLYPGTGRFGRMFPYLEAADHDEEFLEQLGSVDGPLNEADADRSVETSSTPAGFVFLGQFIDHDITLDPLSSLSRRSDPDALRNFRTPRLDLDSVYGAGPEVTPFLYQSPFHGGESDKFLLSGDGRQDLPRNREGVALIGDMRNDENHILAQFQYAMLRFHNAIVDWLGSGDGVFEEANKLARWHYQHVVLHDYLPTVCDEDVVEDVLENREHYTVGREDDQYIPVEFAGAAYRFGHSQARRRYRVNGQTEGKLFGRGDDALGMGFEAASADEAVDWRYLFDLDDADVRPQNAREIDPLMASDLLDLPFIDAEDWRSSLASRNLVRGLRLSLPSGQAVARALDVEPLDNETIGLAQHLDTYDQPAGTEAPLWYYVLAEANHHSDGEHLGPVGSVIVAETLVGLIESDTTSFLTVEPGWEPVLPNPHSGAGEFTAADLLAFAFDGTGGPR